MFTERRSCIRHKVNGPVFASFDGVTGGMILDLSEQGLSMHTVMPLDPSRRDQRVHLGLDLPGSEANLETTGYVAWADALGRAGVRFSELPDEARGRLRDWLTLNAGTPSWKAPRWVVRESGFRANGSNGHKTKGVALSLETESEVAAG